ncbi:MAG TPA: plasmid pRiA4b ORF-3 family protein [Kineosporiaceae bacterium]
MSSGKARSCRRTAESHDPTTLARSCRIMVSARQLAAWTGPNGRRVTPAGALRPTEVPEAAAVLGLGVKPPVRRAADVPQVHQGWLMAVATGMIQLTPGHATATGDSPVADGTTADGVILAGWLDGLRSICTDLSDRRYPEMLQWLVLLVLEALQRDGPPDDSPHDLAKYELLRRVHQALIGQHTLREAIGESRWANWVAPRTPHGSDWRLFDLLTDAGAVQGTPSAPQVTALGRLLAERLRALAPVQIQPHWSPPAVLSQLAAAGHDADVWRLTVDWRRNRRPLDVARQLLGTAAGTDAAARGAAVRLVAQYGDTALPAWHEALRSQVLAPHARTVLSRWDQGPGPQDGDELWLAVEWAAAALPLCGPDEALSYLADAADPSPDGPPSAAVLVAALPRSGHPQADEVAQALAAFLASGAPRSIEHQLQVTVRLAGWRPAPWRRVLIPATDSLGTLGWAISVLFGWGGDHLHLFRAGRRAYTDPAFPLDEADDEDDARLSRLFATGVRKIAYTYDFGARWEHEILLDRLVPAPPGRPGPRCLAFAGDSPLEYPELEDDDGNPIRDPVMTRRFDLDRVNAILASGHYDVDGWDPHDDPGDGDDDPENEDERPD